MDQMQKCQKLYLLEGLRRSWSTLGAVHLKAVPWNWFWNRTMCTWLYRRQHSVLTGHWAKTWFYKFVVFNYISYCLSRWRFVSYVKNDVFWDVAPCRSCEPTFRRNVSPPSSGYKNPRAGKAWEVASRLSHQSKTSSYIRRGKEGGRDSGPHGKSIERRGDTFLRNVGSHKMYTSPHPRKQHSSQSPLWKPQVLQVIYVFTIVLSVVITTFEIHIMGNKTMMLI
jgi:hypothetical protein